MGMLEYFIFLLMIIGGAGNNKLSFFASSPIDLVKDDYVEMRLEHSGTAAVNATTAQFAIEIRL